MTDRLECGEQCPHCNGRIGVLNTRVQEGVRIRWLGCRDCHWRPEQNKQVVPLQFAPRRQRRRHSA